MAPSNDTSVISGTAASNPVEDAKSKTDRSHPHDTTREVFETVVFVVVLVLLLKLFVAEAFVIPTGSMAPTLWGDQIRCTCRECKHRFPINASEGGNRLAVRSYVCENCGFEYRFNEDQRNSGDDFSSISSGDRVLVSKYEYHLRSPRRFEIPVFRYPVEPFSITQQPTSDAKDMQGMNYIKRLVGLGFETVAVFAGDLYVTRDLTYDHIPPDQRPPSEFDAWQFRYMYTKDEVAKEYFKKGKYELVRKSPEEIMAVRRIVYDLNHQPQSLQGVRRTRWHSTEDDGNGFEMEEKGFKHLGDAPGWIRYQHINPWDDSTLLPYYIVDDIGYNAPGRVHSLPFVRESRWDTDHISWCSDLILDCTVEMPSAESEVTLELAKGRNRFQAVFLKGECTLFQVATADDGQETRTQMGSHATKMTSGGKYSLRFANVDCRLSLWVDNRPIPFAKDQSDHASPDPTRRFEPFEKNDRLQPARVGARGDVKCTNVSLWRDLHYNCGFPSGDRRKELEPGRNDIPPCDDLQTYYVQPGHYLMFGDNTNSSADSRSWGLVPERLMLGRAVIIYWPPARVGVIE